MTFARTFFRVESSPGRGHRREGGFFFKGESLIPKLLQAEAEINLFIDRHLTGALMSNGDSYRENACFSVQEKPLAPTIHTPMNQSSNSLSGSRVATGFSGCCNAGAWHRRTMQRGWRIGSARNRRCWPASSVRRSRGGQHWARRGAAGAATRATSGGGPPVHRGLSLRRNRSFSGTARLMVDLRTGTIGLNDSIGSQSARYMTIWVCAAGTGTLVRFGLAGLS